MRYRVGGILIAAGFFFSLSRTVLAQSSGELRTPRGFSSAPPGGPGRSSDLRAPALGASGSPGDDLRVPPTVGASSPPSRVRPEIVAQLQRACSAGTSTSVPFFTPPPALLRNDRRGIATNRPTVDLRRRELQSLEGIIQSTNAADPQRADLYLRAATMWLDLAAESRAANRGDIARAEQVRAIASLQTLTTTYPAYARGDEALFLLGLAHEDVDDMASARRAFLQVIQRYPQSAYVPYVYVNFGEYFFAHGDAPNAYQFFDRVRMFSSATPLWALATLRMASISATRSEWQRARQDFATVVQWARTATDATTLPGIESAATAGFCDAVAPGR